MRSAYLLMACAALAACQPTTAITGRGALAPDPLAAPARVAGGVDPMIVGDRLLEAGEAELALDSYIRAAATQGTTPEVKFAMARANISLGRLKQAERLLRDVIEEEPRNAHALNNLGVVLVEQGEYGEATRVLKTAFALQPSPEIRDNLRVSRERLEQFDYTDYEEEAFTLTRGINGTYDLISPGQQP